jgi:putative ABC transport system substrate-binding protein
MKTFAKELVDLRPDAILGTTTPVISALARETQTIPIVFAIVIDPIGSGFVASLAHPGGNITGFTTLDPALGSKWVGLLKEIAPHTVRALLSDENFSVTNRLLRCYLYISSAPDTFSAYQINI